MSESRLKEYSSTPPRLDERDMLVAFLAPIAQRVHVVSIVIGQDGRFEVAERLSGPPGHNSVYRKEHGDIAQPPLTGLRLAITRLAAIAAEVHRHIPEAVESDEWETDDRRGLAFWHAGDRATAASRPGAFYQHCGVPHSKVDAYQQECDGVWRLILSLVEFPFFRPQRPVAGEAWSFPVQSVRGDADR